MVKFHEFRNSGVSARLWRGRVAMLGKANKPQMRTLQFPLDASPEQLNNLKFYDIQNFYNITDGVECGSLFFYWATVLTSGFQLFATGKAASIFRQNALFKDEAWNETFIKHSNLNFPWFVPSKIIGRILSLPRATGGKDLAFESTLVANEYHKFLVGSSITDKTNEEEREFFMKLGACLSDKFDSWTDASKDIPAAMEMIDEMLHAEGIKTPSLKNIAIQYKPTLPEGATLVFTGQSVNVDKALIHGIYALAGNRYSGEGGLIKFAQEEYITGNASGLSWLFGKGYEYLTSTSLEEVMSDFDISEQYAEQVSKALDAAKAIKYTGVFNEKNYSKFRANFSGKVNSWFANYGSRLQEIETMLNVMENEFILPERLAKAESEHFFSGTDSSYPEVLSLIENILKDKETAYDALSVLTGKKEGSIEKSIECIESYSEMIDITAGILNFVRARVEKEIQIAEGTRNNQQLVIATDCQIKLPKWLKSLPKINRFSGGLPDVNASLEKSLEQFERLRKAQISHFERIMNWCSQHQKVIDPYERIAEREAGYLLRLNPKLDEVNGDLRARRNILQRILKSVMVSSEGVKQHLAGEVRATHVFVNEVDANRHIFEQKGIVYRSAFDHSRHAVYKLRVDVLLNTDWLDLLNEWIKSLEKDIQSGKANQALVDDWLRLSRTYYAIQMSGLPSNIDYPSELAEMTGVLDIINFPVTLSIRLKQASVTAETLQKAFNLYSSNLSGLAYLLFRRSFIVKMRFMRAGDNTLLYTSKNTKWKIPAQLKTSEAPIGIAVRKLGEAADDAVSAGDTISNLLKDKDRDDVAVQAFMAQAPHDWYYSTDLLGNKIDAVFVCKDSIKDGLSKFNKREGLRLIGAPAYKTVLDNQLTGKSIVSDVTLVVEMEFNQTTILKEDQSIQVQAEHSGTRLLLCAPVTETLPPKDEDASLLFNHFVSIDLGEAGIGYAVFDVNTKEKIASGFKRVPTVSNLIRRTRHYQDRPSTRQKFQQQYNINMSEVRENVVGDICHQINRLCAYHKGFPVIEMTGGTTNKQLNSVYDAVLARYTYSGVDAHKTERRQYWMGTDQWVHPTLMTPEYQDGKKTSKTKPLSLFPGASVSSYGNSQTCSCCNKNAFELLKELKDSDEVAVTNGRVKIKSETLLLMERDALTQEDVQKHKREQRRVEMTRPLKSALYKVTELRRILKMNVRRAPTSKRSPDTTQSRFFCPFAECGHEMHADENASINVGRKFIDTKLV